MTRCYKVSVNEILVVTNDRGHWVATMCNLSDGSFKDIPMPSSRVNSIISHCPEIGGLSR